MDNTKILKYALERIASGDTKQTPQKIALDALVDHGNAKYMEAHCPIAEPEEE